MPLDSGARVGPYEIVGPIGAGGMGEVYRARDTQLERDVAIKVLPEELAADPERVARFEREAKVLASLNHPNIAGIHGFESGPSSSSWSRDRRSQSASSRGRSPSTKRSPSPGRSPRRSRSGTRPASSTAISSPRISRSRTTAPSRSSTTGSPKPSRATASADGDSELSQSPTLTRQGTQIGVILGTAAYMSPEQAKGKRVDKRTDIFAFGAVLYEMLTAKRAFAGDDVSETLASVIKDEPEIATAPPKLHRLLTACLQKDPKKRLRDIGDAWKLLEEAPPREATRPGRHWLAGAAVVLAAGLAIGLALGSGLFAPSPPSPAVRRLPIDMQPMTGRVSIDLSRDGRHLVFAANGQLFLRSMDEAEARPISGTEGAGQPFFSPDGERVAFWADGQLRTVPVSGGVPFVVADSRPIQPGWWGERGQIFFGVGGYAPIYRVSGERRDTRGLRGARVVPGPGLADRSARRRLGAVQWPDTGPSAGDRGAVSVHGRAQGGPERRPVRPLCLNRTSGLLSGLPALGRGLRCEPGRGDGESRYRLSNRYSPSPT